jgi:WD40 repeat protein
MAEFNRSLAVVIGINEYQDYPKLQTARYDAERLAEILAIEHKYDYVILVADETYKEYLKGQELPVKNKYQPTLNDLLNLLSKRLPSEINPTKEDRLLFYFAGHGIPDNSDEGPKGYLVPLDADSKKRDSLLPMQELYKYLAALNCRHFLVVLDCCFAGRFRWSSTRKGGTFPRVLHKEHYDRFINSPAWQAMTSASHDQEAFDTLCDSRGTVEGTNHSPFAEGLFRALQGEADVFPASKNGQPAGDGVITATELYLYLRDHVEIGSKERQTPGLWSLPKHDRGEYIFLAPGAELKLKPAPKVNEKNNPYRGLESFDEEHSQFFFGRKELIQQLLIRVSAPKQPLTVVLGVSGSGKSSIVKAGLIPCLKKLSKSDVFAVYFVSAYILTSAVVQAFSQVSPKFLPINYAHHWRILKPMRPGEQPFKALAKAILPLADVTDSNQPDSLDFLKVSDRLDSLNFISEVLKLKIEYLDEKIADFSYNNGEESSETLRLKKEVEKLISITKGWKQGTQKAKQLLIVEHEEELYTLCRNSAEKQQLQQVVSDCLDPLSLRLQSDPNQLIDIVRAWSKNNPGVKLLLTIDQLEELITLSQSKEKDKQNNQQQQHKKPSNQATPEVQQENEQQEWQQFLSLLEKALSANVEQLRIIVTLRSDFEPRFLNSDALKSYWTKARFPVRAMYPDELRQAIERPAAEMALYFQPSNLVDRLIGEVGQMPGALPLLSFTLSELYLKLAEKWRLQETSDRALVLDADFDKEGGVAGSLTRRANKEYDDLLDDNKKATLRRVMLRMVTTEGGESARRRVPLSELVYADAAENERVKDVINRLVEARLIVSGQATGESYVEPAHDFLVRSWDKLQQWQQKEQQDLLLQRQLTPAALAWKRKEQSSSWLEKTEPFLDRCDKRIDSFFDWWNGSNKKDAQEGRKEKKGQILWNGSPYLDVLKNRLKAKGEKKSQFLWNSNPYLDVLKKRLKSYDYWFNQVETEFVQKSVWQRRRYTNLRRVATGFAFLVLIGILLATYIQLQLANIRAKAATAKNILPDRPLNGLLLAIESTGQSQSPILKRFLGSDFSSVQSSLRTATEEVQERNILSGKSPVAISPNGQYIATTSKEKQGEISLWNMWDKNIWRNKERNPTVELSVGDVKLITFSPDGQKILTITSAGQMQLWTLQGNPIDGFPVSVGDDVNSVTFSSNGEMIATGSGSDGSPGRVQLWNLQGNPGYSFPVPDGAINSVAFSPDGQTIVTGSDGSPGRVQLWNLQGNPGYSFPVPDGAINSVAFSPDGRMIVAANAGNLGKLWLWDLQSNKIHNFPIPKDKDEADLRSVTFTSDSRKIISVSNGQEGDVSGGPVILRLWNLTGKLIKQSLYYAPDIAVSADGQYAVTGSWGGSASSPVKLWDLQSNPIDVFSGHEGAVNSVAISPDGQTIVSGGEDKTVRLWNLQGQFLTLNPLTHGGAVKAVAISPDGQTIVSGSDDKTVRLWDIQGNPIGQPLEHEAEVKKVAISPDGQKIVSVNDGKVYVWDIQGNLIGQPFQPKGGISSIAFDDNQTLVIGDSGNKTASLRLFDLQGKPITETFQAPNQNNIGIANSIAVSPDGETIVAGGDESVRLWNRKGKLVGDSFPNTRGTSSVSFSSDGQYIATGDGNTVRLWDNQGNLMGEPLQIHEDNGAVTSVAISRDGQYVVSGSSDGTVRLWRAGNWQIWLQIGCNRLQYHRALNDSFDLNKLDGSEVNRGARATCQKYWK